MTSYQSMDVSHERNYSLSMDGIDRDQGEDTARGGWSIPAHHSPVQHPKLQREDSFHNKQLPYDKLLAVFATLDRQCSERCLNLERETLEALRTMLERWLKARERLYTAQLSDSLDHFQRTALAAAEKQHKHLISQEKAKLAEEHYAKLQQMAQEREHLVQRRLEILRHMETAAPLVDIKQSVAEAVAAATVALHPPLPFPVEKIKPPRIIMVSASVQASLETEEDDDTENAAAVARADSQRCLIEAQALQRQIAAQIENRRVYEEELERNWNDKLHDKEVAAKAAAAEVTTLRTELSAVGMRLQEEFVLGEKERSALLERVRVAEAAAHAASASKEEFSRCSRAAEGALELARSQTAVLRKRVEELIRQNSALKRGMEAANEAVRSATTAERASATDREAALVQLKSAKEALDAHRAAVQELQLKVSRVESTERKLQEAAARAAAMEAQAAAWEERALQQCEDVRVRFAAALRDVAAVCAAAKALGEAGPSCAGPLLATINEVEGNAEKTAVWLAEAAAAEKILERDASSMFFAGRKP